MRCNDVIIPCTVDNAATQADGMDACAPPVRPSVDSERFLVDIRRNCSLWSLMD